MPQRRTLAASTLADLVGVVTGTLRACADGVCTPLGAQLRSDSGVALGLGVEDAEHAESRRQHAQRRDDDDDDAQQQVARDVEAAGADEAVHLGHGDDRRRPEAP